MTKTTISIISIIVVVVALVIGSLLLKQMPKETEMPATKETEKAAAPSGPTNLPTGEGLLTPEEEALEKEIQEIEEHPDTTSAINEDLQEIKIGDLDKGFEDIDKDLEGL